MSDVLKLSVSLRKEIVAEIDARGRYRSSVINRDLERYYHLLRLYLVETVLRFEQSELMLILDAMNGHLATTETIPYFWAVVEDAIRLDGLDRKWGVDGAAVVEKIRGLDLIEKMALLDAIERFREDGSGDAFDRIFGQIYERRKALDELAVTDDFNIKIDLGEIKDI